MEFNVTFAPPAFFRIGFLGEGTVGFEGEKVVLRGAQVSQKALKRFNVVINSSFWALDFFLLLAFFLLYFQLIPNDLPGLIFIQYYFLIFTIIVVLGGLALRHYFQEPAMLALDMSNISNVRRHGQSIRFESKSAGTEITYTVKFKVDSEDNAKALHERLPDRTFIFPMVDTGAFTG